MEIKEAIIHRIIKKAKTTNAELKERTEPSPIDDMLKELSLEVLKAYTKKNNGQGAFDSDKDAYPFSLRLAEYYSEEKDLVEFSLSACNLLVREMKKSFLASGGYVFFVRYTNQGCDWLLILMLKLKPGTSIDPDTLDLLPSLSFDISQLHEAARVNLSKWSAEEQPYLSFIKKSNSSEDITLYFREALGCTEYTDSKANTKVMISAFRDYCKAREYTAEQKQSAEKRFHDYFDEKYNSEDKTVYLEALSAHINDQDSEDFLNFVKENDYPVSNAFPPNKSEYGRLQRIARKFGTVSVGFSVDDINNNVVDYDEDNGQLYIKNVPQSLIDDIRKAKGYE